MPDSYVLECSKLSKSYTQGPHNIDVLLNVDFSVKPGERVAIVGASGSGKSTLLNLLGGLDKPDAGEVRIGGRDFSNLSDNQRGVIRNHSLGFVYQFHHLLPEFSALENVAMPILIGGASKLCANETARSLLKKVGLEARVSHKPSELSGGERQRVAIARALANSPACVLMDEPTGNLDTKNARVIEHLMMDLAQEMQTGFVIVTHDEAMAKGLDRTCVLSAGQLSSYSGDAPS